MAESFGRLLSWEGRDAADWEDIALFSSWPCSQTTNYCSQKMFRRDYLGKWSDSRRKIFRKTKVGNSGPTGKSKCSYPESLQGRTTIPHLLGLAMEGAGQGDFYI